MSPLRLTIGLLAVSPSVVAAQADPPARFLAASAYDHTRHRLVLFGGLGLADKVLGDTWEWDGARWNQLTPATVPPARGGHAMAFDPIRRVVLLFGGAGDDEPFDDLWAFNGVTWKAVPFDNGPVSRIAAQMFWNPDRRAIQLLGGQAMTGRLNDLWEWNGSKWTLLSGSAAPIAASENRAITSAREALMKSELRNLVTAQEAFFADNNRYAKDMAEMKEYGWAPGDDITIEMTRADDNSWSATATHSEEAGGSCMIYVGQRPPSFPEDLEEGSPRCTGFKQADG